MHRYLGLPIGAVLVLTGLTGSLLVFYVEIDRALNPELVMQARGRTARSYEEVVRALRLAHPQRTHSWRLELPDAPDRPVVARYYKPAETVHAAFAPLVVAVDPYTLEIVSSRFWGTFAMTWIYDLHYTLLLDAPGKTILGVISMAALLLLTSGAVLWWPRSGRWKQALTPRLRPGFIRTVYDLHVQAGIYGGLLLLVVTFTGVMLELPGWFNPLLNRASPLFVMPMPHSRAQPGVPPISADRALTVTLARFPSSQPRWIETPNGSDGVYRIWLRQSGEPGQRFPKTQVWVDQYSGQVVAVRDTKANSGGDTLLDWLHPLHSGEAFGMTGRLLVFISGIAPLVLFISGFIIWRCCR